MVAIKPKKTDIVVQLVSLVQARYGSDVQGRVAPAWRTRNRWKWDGFLSGGCSSSLFHFRAFSVREVRNIFSDGCGCVQLDFIIDKLSGTRFLFPLSDGPPNALVGP